MVRGLRAALAIGRVSRDVSGLQRSPDSAGKHVGVAHPLAVWRLTCGNAPFFRADWVACGVALGVACGVALGVARGAAQRRDPRAWVSVGGDGWIGAAGGASMTAWWPPPRR